MTEYNWKILKNNHQVGVYATCFVKMKLTMLGFQITKVSSKENRFVAIYEDKVNIEINVRSLRDTSYYSFLLKESFELCEKRYCAFVLLTNGHSPELYFYLIPSRAWDKPNDVLVDKNYTGLKSKPEWGINISEKSRTSRMLLLNPYLFDKTIKDIMGN